MHVVTVGQGRALAEKWWVMYVPGVSVQLPRGRLFNAFWLALSLTFALSLAWSHARADNHDLCAANGPAPPGPSVSYLRAYRPDLHGLARLAIDLADNVYVTDPDRGRVVVRGPDGRVRSRTNGLGHPVAIAVDDFGGRPLSIYLGDDRTGQITVYTANWEPSHVIGQGAGEFAGLTDIAVDPGSGNLYVADGKAHQVKVYSAAGTHLFSFGGLGSATGQFDHPAALHVDGARGEVLVVDQLNFRVQLFNLDGTFICRIGDLAGSDPGFGSLFSVNARHFTVPQGIWVDNQGLIYVADAAQGWIRVFDRAGVILTDIGTFGRHPGALRVPLDMVADSYGRLFVASSGNGRLEVFALGAADDPEQYAPAVVTLRPNPFDHQIDASVFEAVIEIPGHRLAGLALDSVTANGVAADTASAAFGDADRNGIPDVTLGFPRDALAATLPAEGTATVSFRGNLPDLIMDGAVDIVVVGGVRDDDADGVLDNVDRCLNTMAGAVVDDEGCSIAQLCPCAGPASGETWGTNADYVACTARIARNFANRGLIGTAETGGIVSAAARSTCGRGGS